MVGGFRPVGAKICLLKRLIYDPTKCDRLGPLQAIFSSIFLSIFPT